MILGIIGAMEVEVKLIKEKMQVFETKEIFGKPYFMGKISNMDVALVQCGIGKVNAAVCASNMMREFGATHIINVGIAGTLSSKVGILDVVISKDVAFHDIDHELYKGIDPFVVFFEADTSLIKLATKAIEAQADRKFNYEIGRVVTGDDFINDVSKKSDIASRLAPLCTEMEGAAIAQVCFLNKVPFVILRTISDNSDDELEGEYQSFFDVAAHQSAKILLDMVAIAEQAGIGE